MIKVYLKTGRGAQNYKEKRMVTAIEKALEKKLSKDPSLASTFRPATNFEELTTLHNDLCIEEVEYTEIKPENKDANTEEQLADTDNKSDSKDDIHKEHQNFVKGMQETIEKPKQEVFKSIDPFNEAEPIVRDYVKDNGFKEEGTEREEKTVFEEPTDYKSSFQMPTDEDEKGNGKTIDTTSSKGESYKKEQKQKDSAPINPAFDDMSNGKKKRSTKKFARLIIEGVSLLAEKGCIWWTTKEITDDKLAEYELEQSMNLNLLLTLDNNQKQSVGNWFRERVKDSQTLYKISPQDKDDLIDSLYEVMMEKGIAPSPMQELIINAVKTFVLDMGLKALAMSSQIKSVLTQLKSMGAPERYEAPIAPKEPIEDDFENGFSNDIEDAQEISTALTTTN